MRLLIALLVCLACTCPAIPADQPEFINDRAIRAAIESKGTKLHEAGKTVDNATLQTQLAERRQYDAKPPAPRLLTQDGEALYDTVDDGVIVVARLYLCGRCERLHPNCASGFIVSEDGLAVTNHHVMESADENTVTFVAMTRDGKVYPIVEVLASNDPNDTALVRLGAEEGHTFTPVPIARHAEVGETVHAVSHPQGRFYNYTTGKIARFFVKPQKQNARRVSVTCDYGGGSSGGPIFNDEGQVVAMVSEAVVVRDNKIVFYDSIPYQSILELFTKPDSD